MKTVAFVCEKGGVGKTALSEELFYFCEREGIPASLFCLDGQYLKRDRDTPGAVLNILDTAGSLDANFKKVVQRSDVVVVPVRPSYNDIEPFVSTMDLIERTAHAPVVIVVNAWNHYTMAKRFMEWLESQPWDYPVYTVCQSEYFAQCIGSGHSVVGNDKYGKVSDDIEELCQGILELLDLD